MADGMKLKATAHVKLAKYDEDGVIIGMEERDIELTEKEAEELWRSQQKA